MRFLYKWFWFIGNMKMGANNLLGWLSVLLQLTAPVKSLLTTSLHLTVVHGLGSQSPGTGEEVMDTHS